MGGFFLGLVKGLFATIDKIVVWFVETLYDLLFQISNVQIFTNNDISAFASRITVILTIFMLFKLSFSFLNYIINPDNMTDKSKGFSKIIQNVAVSLVLLVSYQFVFDKAMELQQKIIDNETIPKLILGNNVSAGTGVKNPGTLSFALFSAFVTPNSTIDNCDNYATLENPSARCDLSDYTDGVTNYTSPRGELISGTNPIVINEQFDMIVKYKDTHALFGHMVAWKKGEIFAFDYWFIISTACGVFAGLILLSFCFDIAVRTIKLGFYRLIAPIPIISYIDPNKGEGVFKKWLSNVGKTYADLFIRLIAIYFAIYIIQLVVGGVGTGLRDLNDQPINNPLVIVFIIIGALMFAKQFPKLIQDITGMSFDSKLELNPLKKIRDNALGGKQLVAGAAGAVGAGLTGLGNMAHRVSKFNKNVATEGGGMKGFVKAGGLTEGFKILGSGIAGTTSGFWNTTKNAYSSGKVVEGVKKGIETANTHRTEREIGRESGATTLGIMKAKVQDAFGLPTDYQRAKIDIDNLRSVKSTVDSVNEDAKKEMLIKSGKYLNETWTDPNKKNKFKSAADNYVLAHNRYEALKNVDVNSMRTAATETYRTRAERLADFNSKYNISINAQSSDADIRSQFSSDAEIERMHTTTSTIIGADGKPMITIDRVAVEAAKKARDVQIEAAKKIRDDYKAVSVTKDKHGNEIMLDEKGYANLIETQHYIELDAAKSAEFAAGENAANVFVKMIEDEDESNIVNGSISKRMRVVKQTTEKSSAFDATAKTTYQGSDFEAIKNQTKVDERKADGIESTDKYDRAEASHKAANLGEKSYNNMHDIYATKQKKN